VELLEKRYEPEPNSGCWIWIGATTSYGYGIVYRRGMPLIHAHKLAYEAACGPVPDGLELDHRCRVRSCVNPYHLEAVTHRENVLRGWAPAALHAKKTRCRHGHQYDESNTYRFADGRRRCKTCIQAQNRMYEQRRAKPSNS